MRKILVIQQSSMASLLAGLLTVLAAPPCPAAGTKPQRPNVILVLADDLRWDALGCAGNPVIQTPHLDRLASHGTLFRNAFVTTSICAVSRASILCGQYARRHGINDFATPLTPVQWAQTYPALLRKAGYRTGFIGKFGVGKDVKPMAAEFDYWRGLPGQAGPFLDPNASTKPHATARFGEQALEFLRGCEPSKPFCLSLSFSAPHARDGEPREYPPDPRDEKLYADAMIPVPKLATDEAFRRLPAFVQDSEGRRRWQRRFATPQKFQRVTRDYYRLITGLDREVGRIRAELATRALAANTVILFTSDNGYVLGDRGMADKWLPYEESIRVPLIIYDPRLPASARGRKVSALALNIDLAPTILDLARLPVPDGMQGRSLVPLFREDNGGGEWRHEFFYEHHTLPKVIPPSEAVRTERWKYIRWAGREPAAEELYELRADPDEEHNLAANPDSGKTLAELRGRWQAFRDQLK